MALCCSSRECTDWHAREEGTVEKVSVHDAALQDKLEGDSPPLPRRVSPPRLRADSGESGRVHEVQRMSRGLGGHSMGHTFETYDGDHTNRVPERIEQKVLPFFSKSLKR